ncbi:MAG: TonB-dependent receptor, partial [Spongiibacteraceae bacterium]
ETVLYYASFSRGTKGGGFLNLPTSIAASEFEEEQADTIELGAKINIDRGTVAIALFKTEIDDYQQNLFNGASFDSVQVPLKSEGVDFEAYLGITDKLRFDAQVTYANTLNKDVGYEPQNSPLWSGNVNLTYTTPLVNNGLDISGSVGVAYKSDILWNTLERTIGRSPNGDIYGTDAHSLVNANLALSSGDEWTISLIGKNLTDKKYVSYARVGSFTGTTNAALGMPRTLALQFSYHYN